jgi:hypothetical protein
MPYKWEQFRAEVGALLTVDSNRLGGGDFVSLMVRQGCINLQSHIQKYRLSNESLLLPGDFIQEGKAARAVLPEDAVLTGISLIKLNDDGSFNRYDCVKHDWKLRHELTFGYTPLNDGNPRYAIDPEGYTFYIYPALEDGMMLALNWNGIKVDYRDDEEVPFDEGAVMAVAEFVKAKCAREFQNDVNMHNSYWTTFLIQRRELLLNAQQAAQV